MVIENINDVKNVGDVIKVDSRTDCVNKSVQLAKRGIETDFLYVHERRQGLWLIVTRIDS